MARLPGGERLPLLVRRSDGLPIEAPTYWTMSERVPLGLQVNTLEQELRDVAMLYLWGQARRIDPLQRMRSLALLTLTELNDLDRFCRRTVEEAVRDALAASGDAVPVHRRSKLKPPGRKKVRTRMAAIHSFMDHVTHDHQSQLVPGTEAHSLYASCRAELLGKWKARYEALNIPDTPSPRKGLPAAALERLREVIRPDDPTNPWDTTVQSRNGLIILLLWALGLRRGELLALQTSDITFGPDRTFVRVVRRPDNPTDPRRQQPVAKTLGRDLILEQPVADLLRAYIMGERRRHPAARKHPFVFVSIANGGPLTLSSVTKLFAALRCRVPELPGDLTAHVLRHSWNDAFSAASDRASPDRTDVEKTREERLRCYLMGWSANSEMAARYSQRWIKEAADQRSLSIQRKIRVGVAGTDVAKDG